MAVRSLLVASLVALASTAQAHPGHGAGGGSWSLGHLLGDPLHVGFALVVLVGTAGLLRARRRAGRVRIPRG
ncbi:MAG: hypothetical protein R3263_01230 [Myxococcota bacterium]|nr:hypothetical protein [Myxococcota bacterium]